MSYNLLDEPWLPVVWNGGAAARVGLKEVVLKAGRVREVRGPSPLDTVAVYRFLLAVLQWCKPDPSPEELAEVWRSGRFPPEWFAKLDAHRDAFDLLAPDHGFYQSSDYREYASRPATDLLPELPSGSSVAHFRHTRDAGAGLCPACCAVGLVRLSAFAPSGTHPVAKTETRFKAGKPAGINGVTPTYAVPLGQRLAETLLLNWPLPSSEGDRPGWLDEKEPLRESLGALAALTWRPRRVWLERPKGSERPCLYCGAKARLVAKTAFLPGWRQPFEKEKRWPRDPHLLAGSRGSEAGPLKFPKPEDSLEWHARFWRDGYRAVLEALGSGEDAGRPAQWNHLRAAVAKSADRTRITVGFFGPTVDKGRVALYKDGASLTFPLPAGASDRTPLAKALAGLERLAAVNPFSLLRAAVRSEAKERPEIGAAWACAAVDLEEDLRRAFVQFVSDLTCADPNAPARWQEAVRNTLASQADKVCRLVARGPVVARVSQRASARRLLAHALDKTFEPTQERALS